MSEIVPHLPSNREAAVAAQLGAHERLEEIYAKIREDSMRAVGTAATESYLFTANKIRADLDMIDQFSRQILPVLDITELTDHTYTIKTVVDSPQEARVVSARALELWTQHYGYLDIAYPIGVRHFANGYSQLLCASPLQVETIEANGMKKANEPTLHIVELKTPLALAYGELVHELDMKPFTPKELKSLNATKDNTFVFTQGEGNLLIAGEALWQPRRLKHMTPQHVFKNGLDAKSIYELYPDDIINDAFDFSRYDIERGMAELAFMFDKGDAFKKILEDRLANEPERFTPDQA
jgi:hypothetical protein